MTKGIFQSIARRAALLILAASVVLPASRAQAVWPEKPIKGFFVRKEVKGHGTDQPIDGLLERGSRVILFEDVTTTGGSAMQAVERVHQCGCTVLKVISVVDRLEGAEENFKAAGIEFESLFTRRDFT